MVTMSTKLTAKNKLHEGDMLINNKTGTIILLIKKELVVMLKPTNENLLNEGYVAFWKIHVTKVGTGRGILPGFTSMKEKNIRSKIKKGILSLIKNVKKEN